MPKATHTTTTPNPNHPPPVPIATRRTLFGSMGAMLLLTAAEAGQAKAAELDSELLACCKTADRSYARASAIDNGRVQLRPGTPEWDEVERLDDVAWTIWQRLPEVTARTPEGLQAKAKLVLFLLEDTKGLGTSLAMSLARDVLGRARA